MKSSVKEKCSFELSAYFISERKKIKILPEDNIT